MILKSDGRTPSIDPTARIAPNATLCGDVTVGPNSSIGFGTVVVSEGAPVSIGANCVVMENAVLRGVETSPLVIKSNVLIGPHCYLSGCDIEDEVFLATGCTVFNGARVGRGAEVRVNAVVHIRTVVPAGSTVPIGWIAVGDPAQLFSPDRHDEIWSVQEPLNFPKFVFGVDHPPLGKSMMTDVMPRYAARLRRRHAGDATPEDRNIAD